MKFNISFIHKYICHIYEYLSSGISNYENKYEAAIALLKLRKPLYHFQTPNLDFSSKNVHNLSESIHLLTYLTKWIAYFVFKFDLEQLM